MTKFVDYNPAIHKHLPLYEIQSVKENGFIVTKAVPSRASHEVASRMPLYYMVRPSDVPERIIIKGGPKSGFHGHQGLPGIWGGSTPRSGGGAAKPKTTTKKPPSKKAHTLAKKAVKAAKKHEAKTTAMVTGLAEKHGGKMAMLQHRLKKSESLAKKIRDEAEDSNISEEEAASSITDVVRYTMLFESEDYVEKVNEVQAEMVGMGWTKYDEKFKNYFAPGDDYDGYNTVVHDGKGNRFELQFHTPQSLDIKEKVHKLYKTLQNTPEGDPSRIELYEEMVSHWSDYERPPGWEKLSGTNIKRSMR